MTKEDLRRPLRAARRARTTAERHRLAARIAIVGLEMPVIRAAGCVALYASLPDEPGTGPFREALRAQGIRVLLPVVPTNSVLRPDSAGAVPGDHRRDDEREPAGTGEHTLYWGEDDGGELTAGAGLGMPEPGGGRLRPEALGTADVVVVPALAVDGVGNRLGKGRGYYDAALRHAASGAPVLALLFDDEVLTTPIPVEDHDVPVNGVLTPSRWMIVKPLPGA